MHKELFNHVNFLTKIIHINIFLNDLFILADLAYHGTNRFSSRSSIYIKANNNITGSIIQNNNKAKAHGALMVIAWMLLASTGILFARLSLVLNLD